MKTTDSRYTVQAESLGYRQAAIPASRLSVSVTTIAEAREEFERWRDESEVLSSTFVGGEAILSRDGTVIGAFSYNGRLWCNCGEETLHAMCEVPPARSLPKGATSDFLRPAPSFQLDKGKDGSVTIVPIK